MLIVRFIRISLINVCSATGGEGHEICSKMQVEINRQVTVTKRVRIHDKKLRIHLQRAKPVSRVQQIKSSAVLYPTNDGKRFTTFPCFDVRDEERYTSPRKRYLRNNIENGFTTFSRRAVQRERQKRGGKEKKVG